MPVHENGVHWCLLVVHIPKREILYYDRYAQLVLRDSSCTHVSRYNVNVHHAGCAQVEVMTPSRSFHSVYGHLEYYNVKRAKRLIKALFMWLVLEAIDKDCEERVLGSPSLGIPRSPSKHCSLDMVSSVDMPNTRMHTTAQSQHAGLVPDSKAICCLHNTIVTMPCSSLHCITQL